MQQRITPVLIAAVVAIIAVLALILSATSSRPQRTYTLGARPLQPILGIDPPRRMCQGPLTSVRPFDGVQVWAAALAHQTDHVDIVVRDAGNKTTLAHGPVTVTDAAGPYTARLNQPVTGTRAVQVCIAPISGHYIALGTMSVNPSVTLDIHPGLQFAVNLIDDRGSLLGAVPRMLSRAALWHPGWVGAWTFWLLGAGILASFGVGIAAVARAAREDEQSDEA